MEKIDIERAIPCESSMNGTGDPVRLSLFKSNHDYARKCGGRVVLSGGSLEETLQIASTKLGDEVYELRSLSGATIECTSLLRDWDAVIAVTKDHVSIESSLSSPTSLVADSDIVSDTHSESPSVPSNSSSIMDLREKNERNNNIPHTIAATTTIPFCTTTSPLSTAATTTATTTATTPPFTTATANTSTNTSTSPLHHHRCASTSSFTVKTPETGDFGLRVTSFVPTPDAASRNDWVRINMGGRIFATTRATLTSDPNSMLARMFESEGWCSAIDSTGAFLIDRSPDYFEPLLNYLRHNKLILNEGINPRGVLEEAKFFGLSKAIELLESHVQNDELALNGHFTRKEFLRLLSITSSSSALRCQGMDFENVDLSNLDLRHINFKCANLRGSNLSQCDLTNCVFERADLSCSNLDGAVAQCVRMPRANLEGASMKGCVMDSNMGIPTNLEGANLKGVMLDNSQMNGINLRLASLKGASLRSCNLRYAIMAGTDLENCDLTGCDLQQTNLRGSNLAGTILEDIIAPLHMSQTVNVTTISIQSGGGGGSGGGSSQGGNENGDVQPPPLLPAGRDSDEGNQLPGHNHLVNHH